MNWQNRGLLGKVDEEEGLMLGIIVSLWKMIRAVNLEELKVTQPNPD